MNTSHEFAVDGWGDPNAKRHASEAIHGAHTETLTAGPTSGKLSNGWEKETVQLRQDLLSQKEENEALWKRVRELERQVEVLRKEVSPESTTSLQHSIFLAHLNTGNNEASL